MLRPMLSYARKRGVNIEPILRDLGLTFAQLDDVGHSTR